MHPTAKANAKRFFDTYLPGSSAVLEIGSMDVNGSLRDVVPSPDRYLGADMAPGRGVDVVLIDPYVIPFSDETFDAVISSSTFEHSQMFWLTFLDGLRVLRPRGLFYLNVPSNGYFHRYPVDCWRLYPDAGDALVAWAQRNGIHAALLESYTSMQRGDIWNDFVAVFVKDEGFAADWPKRIVDDFHDCENVTVYGSLMSRIEVVPEDMRRARS